MIPNIHIHEHLMFERQKALLREMEQQHILAGLAGQRFRLARHLAAKVGAFLMALGSGLKQLETREKQVV
jgi:hypothetical protein